MEVKNSQRRDGLQWDSELYKKLLQYIIDNNKSLNADITYNLSLDDIKPISIFIHPKFGHYKKYKENLLYFLQCYVKQINQDCNDMKNGITCIDAPLLKAWLNYRHELCVAMSNQKLRKEVDKFLSDLTYKIPLQQRKMIVCLMCNINVEECDKKKMKNLTNVLNNNRDEICQCLKPVIDANHEKEELIQSNSIISNNSSFIEKNSIINNNYNEENNSLEYKCCNNDREHNTKDINCTKNQRIDESNGREECNNNEDECSVLSNTTEISKKNTISRSVMNDQDLTPKNDTIHDSTKEIKTHVLQISDINSKSCKITVRQKKKQYKKDKSCRITDDMIQFDEKNDNCSNEQISLLKKLIILKIVSNKSESLDAFLKSSLRVSKEIKKKILGIIYHDIKEYHYSILDLLIPYRYLIFEKEKEFIHIFDYHKIDLRSKLLSVVYFQDAENIFYDVLKQIKNAPKNVNIFEKRLATECDSPVTHYTLRNKHYLQKKTLDFSIADDIATYVTIDLYLGMSTHKVNKDILNFVINADDFRYKVQMEMKKFISRSSKIDVVITNLMHLINIHMPKFEILAITKLRRQLISYLNFLNAESKFSIEPCYRYKKENFNGAKIIATKSFPKNEILHCINGFTTSLNNAELEYLKRNKLDFSITTNYDRKKNKLWLGPGSFVNHSCKPNTNIYFFKNSGELCLQVTKDIKENEELTTDYGSDYFKIGECECLTCKPKLIGD